MSLTKEQIENFRGDGDWMHPYRRNADIAQKLCDAALRSLELEGEVAELRQFKEGCTCGDPANLNFINELNASCEALRSQNERLARVVEELAKVPKYFHTHFSIDVRGVSPTIYFDIDRRTQVQDCRVVLDALDTLAALDEGRGTV